MKRQAIYSYVTNKGGTYQENMSREDVSFTFLHRVDEVELNIEDGRWQSALALALTLPDPSLWITDEFFWEKVQNPGLQNLAIPTILLTKKKKDERSLGSEDTRLTVLSMPVHPDELRRAVNDCLTKGGA